MPPSSSESEDRQSRTTSVGESIGAFLSASGLEGRFYEQKVLADWERLVRAQLGASASAAAQAHEFRNGELIVRVQHSGWRHRLMFERPRLVDALNRAVGRLVVRSIRVV